MAYTPLRISTVKPDRELTFELFIFFKDNYLKYAEKGGSLDQEKYTKLKKQKIAKFYIDESDEMNYQQFLDLLLEETMNSSTATVDEKVNLVEGACDTAVEKMQKDPGSEVAYNMTKKAAKNLRSVIEKNPEALKKIFGRKADEADMVIKHSLNVSALSVKLGKVCKLDDDEIDDLATAALIHDVGITQMPKEDRELFKKPRRAMTPDDRRLYAFHVKESLEMLKSKSYVNKRIMEFVENHEEVRSGDGPQKKTKLSTGEEILSLINCYDKLCITRKLEPKEALKELNIEELGNYDLDLINKFKAVLKEEGLLD
jgi:HD-GYP domain-containing protein (c-di-GMP phosphodiesterase class II)